MNEYRITYLTSDQETGTDGVTKGGFIWHE